MEFPAGEIAARLAADMDGERRRGGVEELLGVIVGEDDPEVGLERAQLLADVGRHLPHVLDVLLVLGLRHGEELRRMGQHGAADHGRHHDVFSLADPDAGERARIRPRRSLKISRKGGHNKATLHSRKGSKYALPKT